MKTLRLEGFGWQLLPRPPFELGRLAAGDPVIVHHAPPEARKLRVSVSHGHARIALGPGTRSPEEVLHDWHDGQPLDGAGWTLAFDAGYAVPWPEGTSAWSTEERASWPVELTLAGGLRDEMPYVQGPFDRTRAPALASLVAEGMETLGSAHLAGLAGTVDGIELRYRHDGREWRQWRCLVPLSADVVLLVTAQAAGGGYARMLALVQEVAGHLHATSSPAG